VTPSDGNSAADRPSIDPRIRQRRLAILRDRGRRRLYWIGGALGLVVLALLLLVVLHTPWFSARVVTVSGAHPHTPTASIIAAAGLDGHPPLISVDPGSTAARVEALPYIASAIVERHWPDAVVVAVTERAPVVTMAGPGSSWSVLDGQGRTLQVLAARPAGLIVFVVHTTGGGVPPGPVGSSLPAVASVGLAVCRTLPPAFVAQVVTATVAPDGTASLGLNSGITVLLGTDDDLKAKYEDVAAIIAHAQLVGATTIDVTVPQSPTVAR
jgi:cell division protein FtsQ